MMKPQDLPLTAIRAFVTVGRHGTFTRAAAALGVTQGAISRHIAHLEGLAGSRLFDRRGASIQMTSTGLQLYDALKDAVSTIEITMQLLAQNGRWHDRLKVRTSMPSLAMTVIVPALGIFTGQHGAQVDLITSLDPPQPQDEFDVLITRDLSLNGTESWELARETLVCVGSPARVAQLRAQTRAEWPMVASRSRPQLAATWAIGNQLAPDQLNVVATYDHLFLAITAAVAGTGVIVVPELLVLDQLRAGALVPTGTQAVSSGASYIGYVSERSHHVEAARSFCRWLKGMLRERMGFTQAEQKPNQR